MNKSVDTVEIKTINQTFSFLEKKNNKLNNL